MARPLRVAVLGWSCGFALALLAGARQANSPTLATILLAAALTSMAAVAVLLVATMVHDRRGAHGEAAVDAEAGQGRAVESPAASSAAAPDMEADEPLAPSPAPALTVLHNSPRSRRGRSPSTAAARSSAPDDAAARVAALEARLAEEQRELDAIAAKLAAADKMAGVTAAAEEPADNPTAIEEEPVLRKELLDAVSGLTRHGATGATARELEELLRSRR